MNKEAIKAIKAINELAAEIHDIALDHGFWESDRSIGESISLIHSELSEWLEAVRHRGSPESMQPFQHSDEHCPDFLNEEIEAADAIIRILDLCQKEQYNIGKALIAKITFNKSRPYKHGKNF